MKWNKENFLRTFNKKVHWTVPEGTTQPSEIARLAQKSVQNYVRANLPREMLRFHLEQKNTVIAVVCKGWNNNNEPNRKHLWIALCGDQELDRKLKSESRLFSSTYLPLFKDVPEELTLEEGAICMVNITHIRNKNYCFGNIRKVFFPKCKG